MKWRLFRRNPGLERGRQPPSRNVAALAPQAVYGLILSEMPLPPWMVEIMEPLLAEIGSPLIPEHFEDFTGEYRFHEIRTPFRRIALVYVSGDVAAAAFEHVADFAGRMALRQWDALYIFSDAATLPGVFLEQRNNWVGSGRRVTFCLSPDIERLRTPADPSSRKAVLRAWFEVDQAPATAMFPSTVPVTLDPSARKSLIGALARASEKQVVANGYFDRLLDRTKLTGDWVSDVKRSFSNSPDGNARILVDAAAAQGSRGAPSGYTTLGWLLETVLPTLPTRIEQSIAVSAMLEQKLLTGEAQIQNLAARYQVPRFASQLPDAHELGPDLAFADPGEIELQSYMPPPLMKVDDVRRYLDHVGAVCLVSVPKIKGRTGTGFLVGPSLILTNCHVLLRDWRMPEKGQRAEVERNLEGVELRFRYTGAEKDPEKGQTFTLANEKPLVRLSVVPKLDYVLLRVEPRITADRGLWPAACTPDVPALRSALHIVQHPHGEVMQVDFNTCGVTHVDEDRGLLQYVTHTASGSSGSPCFNEDWKVVGLHHAERPRYQLWSIREGVLLRAILNEIGAELNTEEEKRRIG
jgi:endonuclease G